MAAPWPTDGPPGGGLSAGADKLRDQSRWARGEDEEPGMSGGWADGIVANTLFVRDLAAAKEFYGRAFETEPIFEDPNSVVFKLGPVIVNLLHESAVPELVGPAVHAGPEAGVRLVFTVGVEDVDTRVETLKAAGVELLNGPMDRRWGPRTASFRDLDGYVWEIAGEPKAKD